MTRKANALFSHNESYTFRQLMISYRFWKYFSSEKCMKRHGFKLLKKGNKA